MVSCWKRFSGAARLNILDSLQMCMTAYLVSGANCGLNHVRISIFGFGKSKMQPAEF